MKRVIGYFGGAFFGEVVWCLLGFLNKLAENTLRTPPLPLVQQ